MSKCNQCGQCCIHNGLIPPVIPGEAVPAWLDTLVSNLRRYVADVAEDYPCVFLDGNCRCVIHDVRPEVCREFECDAHTPSAPIT